MVLLVHHLEKNENRSLFRIILRLVMVLTNDREKFFLKSDERFRQSFLGISSVLVYLINKNAEISFINFIRKKEQKTKCEFNINSTKKKRNVLFNHICNHPIFHYNAAVVVLMVQLFDCYYYNDFVYYQFYHKI